LNFNMLIFMEANVALHKTVFKIRYLKNCVILAFIEYSDIICLCKLRLEFGGRFDSF